jgi:hypothetical protein
MADKTKFLPQDGGTEAFDAEQFKAQKSLVLA